MKVGIVGSGLGGLLSGVSLLQNGYDVEIFEKLLYTGGRFTNHEYKGYQLSTGALHMIPHGHNGPLGRMLKSLGVNVKIVKSKPEAYYRINGEDYLFDEIGGLIPPKDKLRAAFVMAFLKFGWGGKGSYREWLKRRLNNQLAFDIADSFCGWCFSMNSAGISSKELISITTNTYRRGGPGVPIGGCKGVSGALIQEFENLGGKIRLKTKIEGIAVEGKKANGVIANKNHPFDIVVSDIGPKATVKLCGKENFDQGYIKNVESVKSTAGIKISIACDRPMLGHTGVLFTLQTKRVNGLNEVTNADPSLAPAGKHLMMSHQTFSPGKDIKAEVQLAKEDLKTIFPDFDKYCRVLAVQVYKDEWPVNRAPSGTYINPVSPINGLYYVGDAIKSPGWMETEGLAVSVDKVLKAIENYEA